MDYRDIIYAVDGAVAILTLNRPDRMNAGTSQMVREILHALDRADSDDRVRVLILTGAGERAYCAGADLSGGADSFAKTDAGFRDGTGEISIRIFDLKKPVIVAFNGVAVGMGVTMTLAADMRLAAPHARFGFVFARRGVIPEGCSTWFLPRLVGIAKAQQWVMSGRLIAAPEALEHGLIDEIVPMERLMARARAIADEIAQNTSAVCVALARQMMWTMLSADHPIEANKLESNLFVETGASADAREGIRSFLEKRPPQFPMKPSSDMPAIYPWRKPRSFA